MNYTHYFVDNGKTLNFSTYEYEYYYNGYAVTYLTVPF